SAVLSAGPPRPRRPALLPYATLFRSHRDRPGRRRRLPHPVPRRRDRARRRAAARGARRTAVEPAGPVLWRVLLAALPVDRGGQRSEEHTSELQSRENLVCRRRLEKKN